MTIGREFNRNMFIMLLAIMIGAVIITFFIADLQRRSEIEILTYEHETEIIDLGSRNENLTNHFLQGSIWLDSAREIKEKGNYYFDFASFWYSNANQNADVYYNGEWYNATDLCQLCIDNCEKAMVKYLAAYQKYNDSIPYYVEAKGYTDKEVYHSVLDYYINFANAGKNITLLRYNSSKYLMFIAENLSFNNSENVSLMLENFNLSEELYLLGLIDYEERRGLIDSYLFFDPNREPS